MRRVASLVVTASLVAAAFAPVSASTQVSGAVSGPRGESIYFVMTDRYANGDSSNDRGGFDSAARQVHGFDPTDPGWFHGGDLSGLTGGCTSGDGLARIRAMGFTALWITPPFVQEAVNGDSAAYHGYWFTDLTDIDPHLGSKREFRSLVECAHSLGMKVYLDIVVNHTADVIEYSSGNSFIFQQQSPYRDSQGRRINPDAFSGVSFPSLSLSRSFPKQVSLPKTPAKSPLWLNDLTNYHNRGDASSCGWSAGECSEMGDFFGLDDLFTEKYDVVKGLADAYGYWLREFHVDGFRVDTVKHVDRNFMRRWLPLLVQASSGQKRQIDIFGEVYDPLPSTLADFVTRRSVPTVLDFAFQEQAVRFASGRSSRGLASVFAADDDYTTPTSSAQELVTFLGNHDMGRVGFLLRSEGVARNELLERTLLAHDLLFLSRGNPTVYYGDEVGMTGSGDGRDKRARQSMFPTQVRIWQEEERIGSSAVGTGSALAIRDHPIMARISLLNELRNQHSALRVGPQTMRFAQDRVISWSRFDPQTQHEYVIAMNSGSAASSVALRTATPSASWSALIGNPGVVTSSSRGELMLTIPAMGTVVVRADLVSSPRQPRVSALRVRENVEQAMWSIEAVSTGADTDHVSFFFRLRATDQWKLLGTDVNSPYRVNLDPARFRPGRVIQLKAVRQGAGGEATSPLREFRVERLQ